MKMFGKVIFMVLIFLVQLANAQEKESMLQQWIEDDQEIVEALVLYPEATRKIVFEACSHPEALVKIDRIQMRTSQNFKELVSEYSKDEQEGFYNLSRYPGLVDRIVENGPKSRSELVAITAEYPDDIQSAAKKYGSKRYEVLRQINRLQKESDTAFAHLLEGYSPTVQDAYKELMEEPEIMNLLTDNIKMAILVGDLYQRDKDWLIKKADSLHLEVARRNTEELEDWKNNLEDDYYTLEEAKEAAREFAKDNEYDVEPYDERRIEIIYRPYPYWFGYPYWYPYPYWRPYPYWYHTGFYFDSYGSVVIVGLPSFYYTHWFFRQPRRYNYWNDHFYHHYRTHPRSNSSVVYGLRTSRSSPEVRQREIRRTQPTDKGAQRTVTPRTRTPRTKDIDITRRQRSPASKPSTSTVRKREYNRHQANEHHRQTWNRTPRQRSPRSTGTVNRTRKRDN